MKKILLLSDTHSHIDDAILKHVKQADEVWHAGDIGNLEVTDTINKLKPLRAVYGNIDGNDARAQFPLDNKFRVEEVSVWMTHIGGYPNKYHIRVREELKKIKPTIFISGHSHILKVQYDKKLILGLNNPKTDHKLFEKLPLNWYIQSELDVNIMWDFFHIPNLYNNDEADNLYNII